MTPTPPEPSGLTVDGLPVPLSIEADGPAAIEAHCAAAAGARRPEIDTAPNPPTFAEGAE